MSDDNCVVDDGNRVAGSGSVIKKEDKQNGHTDSESLSHEVEKITINDSDKSDNSIKDDSDDKNNKDDSNTKDDKNSDKNNKDELSDNTINENKIVISDTNQDIENCDKSPPIASNNYIPKLDPSSVTCRLWKLINPKYNVGGSTPSCHTPSCSSSAPLTCSGCQQASYCSKEHQRVDWAQHKQRCAPFKMVQSKEVGRHLVATRKIRQGEVIFEEQPVTAGPRQYTPPICLGCHAPVSLSGYRCSSCRWPMCNQACEKAALHRAECSVFTSAAVSPTQLKKRGGGDPEPDLGCQHPMYECVTPMRVCLVMAEREQNWGVVQCMETHRDDRQLEDNSLHNQHNIVEFLIKHAKLANHLPNVSAKEITHANDVLDVNSFEIRGHGGSGPSLRGLYPLTAMMNSSCSPNTQNSIDQDFVCRVRAARDIKKGEEIRDTYTTTLSNTISRRRHLKTTKYFYCGCNRCKDPTELGSHFSTLICSCGGHVLSTDPLKNDAPWECTKCKTRTQTGKVLQEQDQWEDKLEGGTYTVPAQESYLEELLKIYHPNHSLCVDVKFNLVQLYGRGSGDSLEEANKKVKLCEEIISVMDAVTPGYFRMRGMFLAEMYSTKLYILRKGLEAGSMARPIFVSWLKKLRPLLTEAQVILGFEPPGSIEAMRLETVNAFLKQLDEVVGQAGAKS